MSLSDARRMYVLLRDSGAEGCHSHQLRRQGVTGNPSQRAKDIVSHGVAIWTARENVGKRPGSRYWLEGFQPSDAVRVVPNFRREAQEPPAQRDAASAHASGDSAALSITPSPPDTHVPVAIVRDFTDPEGCWREIPVSELDFDYEAAA